MKKSFLILLCCFVAVGLIGCVSAKKVTKERVDQEIAGNAGCIQGEPKIAPRATSTTREYIQIDVEVPTPAEIRQNMPKPKTPREDRSLEGNRGYMGRPGSTRTRTAAPQAYEETIQEERYEETETTTYAPSYTQKEPVYETKKELTYDTYTVKQGDSLSKIAGRPEIYGKMGKWRKIYEANKDKIQDPNKLKPGLVLRIPREEEVSEESKYIK